MQRLDHLREHEAGAERELSPHSNVCAEERVGWGGSEDDAKVKGILRLGRECAMGVEKRNTFGEEEVRTRRAAEKRPASVREDPRTWGVDTMRET